MARRQANALLPALQQVSILPANQRLYLTIDENDTSGVPPASRDAERLTTQMSGVAVSARTRPAAPNQQNQRCSVADTSNANTVVTDLVDKVERLSELLKSKEPAEDALNAQNSQLLELSGKHRENFRGLHNALQNEKRQSRGTLFLGSGEEHIVSHWSYRHMQQLLCLKSLFLSSIRVLCYHSDLEVNGR
ncbi:hypothetical protein FB645_005089 [Coemansia sp. IMI 203386]|nr:hypothetical protein FB645_005089 [Coemansia sp. IMI 203386]